MISKTTNQLIAAIALAGIFIAVAAPEAQCKASKSSKGKNYLVPPPPAYAPSILPELAYSRYSGKKKPVAKVEEEKPYSKYVFTRSGYEIRAKKQNPYVTYWTN